MEQLFKELEVKKSTTPKSYAELIEKAGIKKMPTGYSVITEDAIYNFLLKKVKEDIEADGREVKYIADTLRNQTGSSYFSLSYTFKTMSIVKKWFFTREKEGSDYFSWNWVESDIQIYEGNPPIHILEKIISEKGKFDCLKIVTICKDKRLPDPLLIGRNNGDENRYLIDWWDTDIDPSEIEIK